MIYLKRRWNGTNDEKRWVKKVSMRIIHITVQNGRDGQERSEIIKGKAAPDTEGR